MQTLLEKSLKTKETTRSHYGPGQDSVDSLNNVMACKNCGKLGHFTYECRNDKKAEKDIDYKAIEEQCKENDRILEKLKERLLKKKLKKKKHKKEKKNE